MYTLHCAAAGFLPPPVPTSPPPLSQPPSSADGNSLQHHHTTEANYPVALSHCSPHCHVSRVPVTAVSPRVCPAPRSTGDWRWALRDPDVSLGRVQPSSGGAASSVQPPPPSIATPQLTTQVICKNICMAKLCSLNKVCKLRTMPPLLPPPRPEHGTACVRGCWCIGIFKVGPRLLGPLLGRHHATSHGFY